MSKETWYVDIPALGCITNPEGAWIPAATFDNKAEAIAFAQKVFGADETGSVCLVTGWQ